MKRIFLALACVGWLAPGSALAGSADKLSGEVRQAVGAVLDLERDVQAGDRFQLRYQRSFTAQGVPIGVGRLIGAELQARDKGTIGVQRFHAARHGETLWLTSGQAAVPAAMRLPLDTIAISSRFGMRADPFDQPKAVAAQGPVATRGTGRAMNVTVDVATKRGVLAGLSSTPTVSRAVGRASPTWYMHEGIDLVAPIGTPISVIPTGAEHSEA